MEEPDGSFTVPARPEVPADWAINNGAPGTNKEAMVNFANNDRWRTMDLPFQGEKPIPAP
jgi:hypothetical protein